MKELALTPVHWAEMVGCWPSLSEDSIESERQLLKSRVYTNYDPNA
jgi:hypothetical protein